MVKFFAVIGFAFFTSLLYSQSTLEKLSEVNVHYKVVLSQKDSLESIIEDLKLKHIIERIYEVALPELQQGEEVVCHSAMCLVFSNDHKLAKWVIHKLTNDVVTGRVSRTNDFRNDPKISNTGVEADYFIKNELPDGTYAYEGFGYDRGHLAPSADFRWSEKALSESYYYSNITPQTPELNREKWAEIEDFLRTYIYNNQERNLFIVTAPVLEDDLPVIEKGVNKLPIPKLHYKIAVDYDNKMGIAFLMPQRNLTYPIEWYAVSVDSIESLTGINFFPSLSEEDEKLIESTFDFSKWIPNDGFVDVLPFNPEELPRNTYNTIQAKQLVNYHRTVTVCGTVVSTHKSGNGHVFINLDKSFPNQIFSATIWASDVINFGYKPEIYLKNKKACFTGKVVENQGVPTMNINNEKRVEIIQ